MTRIDTTCVTHSYACDCREAKFSALEAENTALKARVEKLRGALEFLSQVGCTDGGCLWREHRGGQHTNGGCNCFNERSRVEQIKCFKATVREALEADKPSS